MRGMCNSTILSQICCSNSVIWCLVLEERGRALDYRRLGERNRLFEPVQLPNSMTVQMIVVLLLEFAQLLALLLLGLVHLLPALLLGLTRILAAL